MDGTTLTQFFAGDHREADASWAAVEQAVETGDREAAAGAFETYKKRMLRHFAMEEEVLFPAFEEETGMRSGPTEVMRREHEQMKGLLAQMEDLCAKGDLEELLNLGDTQLMLVQQHNQKEETILYPMAEGSLAGAWSELLGRLESY